MKMILSVLRRVISGFDILNRVMKMSLYLFLLVLLANFSSLKGNIEGQFINRMHSDKHINSSDKYQISNGRVYFETFHNRIKRSDRAHNPLTVEGTINNKEPSNKSKNNISKQLQNRIKLSETPECESDIRRICAVGSLNNNFAVLDCLQNDKKREDAELTPECHHLIWTYKRNLTVDNRFVTTAKRICSKFLDTHQECKPLENIRGQLLSCLMEHVENATEAECRSFLRKMEAIVFSDYRLIYKFAEECSTDISKFNCGRLDTNSEDNHSQGETIECLSQKTEKLSDGCRHEILRIAELQGDDFHLDRPLFFACREDRERFCEKIESGDGRVYRCLMRHKMERDMSHPCREKLFQRERLVVHDYKINRGLAKACRENIKIYHCRDDTSDRREIRLSQILLCLENALHKGYPVAGECQAEMMEHRRTLMEYYQLTPELASSCDKDIQQFCKRLEIGGKTIHCLMGHVKASRHDSGHISDKCRREIEGLLKQTDVGDDWRVDPVLQEACQPVVDAVCSDVHPGEGRVMGCLMDHFDSKHMTEDCKEKLLQIQYFVARDFKMDPLLYKRCKKDAEKICRAKKEWYDKPSKLDPERGPIVLPCLYRYAYHPDQNSQLSRECLYELRRVMRQRAISVDLQPDIQEPCMNDLSKICNENVEKGEEMKCLQNNLDKLSVQCQKAVGNFTEEEAEHAELNYPLYHACLIILKKHCSEVLSKDIDQGDLMQCLISHKNDPDMKTNQKCRVSVEHFQLISLKDYRFSFKFKESCKKDVLNYCKNVKTKAEVISCLSTLVTNDTITENTHQRVSKECRNNLKVELLHREENIKLDPELDAACTEDQKKFCSNTNPGEAQILECLKNHQKELSPKCHKLIFNREKEGMNDNSVDYALISTCKAMIKQHCSEYPMNQVLECLKDKRDDVNMDLRCRKLVMKRMVEQNSDYRLNLKLQQACYRDIRKFCQTIVDQKPDEEFEGKVISCLKLNYRKNRLSQLCETEIVQIIREVAKDYQLDPQLVRSCSGEIQEKCSDEPNIEECLKNKFQKKELLNPECRNEVARIIFEGKADIQSDPILYRVCVKDIKHYCNDIPAGQGKQLSCLLAILEKETPTLSDECKSVLTKRVEMFEYAAQVAPAETVEEIIRQVATSPARNYFIIVALGVLGIIFIGGLFCGRVTKRVPVSVKNK